MEEPKITVEYDKLITKHGEWVRGEQSDASNSGLRRQQIGQFAESVGVEGKALSQIRAGLKIKNEGKRADWLRSMEAMLPIAAQYIRGNQTEEMDFDDAKAEE